LAENLSCKSVEMLDATVETIKKLTGANVEHAALIANSKILTLFSRFVGSILCNLNDGVKVICFSSTFAF